MPEDKIITVIGGTGFLGRYIVRELAEAGFRVRIICRNVNAGQWLRTLGNPGQIALSYGDLGRPETITPQLAGSYGVVNAVGILYESAKQRFTSVHAHGAERVAQASRLQKVSAFVQISALGVDKASGSEYARTKLLGEKAVRASFPEAAIVRPSVMFGPEDNFFNQFARMAVFNPMGPLTLPLIGGGRTRFQPVYVGDVAAAVRKCITDVTTRGKLYELGGPEVMSFKAIMDYVLKLTQRKRFLAPLPFPAARAFATLAEWLPKPPLTRDQVQLLKTDNVVSEHALTLKDLGIDAHALSLLVPDYLLRYRRHQPAMSHA